MGGRRTTKCSLGVKKGAGQRLEVFGRVQDNKVQFRSNKRRRTTKVGLRRAQDNKVQFRSQKRRRTTKVVFR